MQRVLFVGRIALALCLCNCAPLTGGVAPSLLSPKTASYYASPGVMGLAPYVVFRDQAGALSLQAGSAKDVQWHTSNRKVVGRACQYGVQLPLGLSGAPHDAKSFFALSAGFGDGGVGMALEDASRGLATGEMLYDLRVDLNTVIILGVWREACVVVHAYVSPGISKGVAMRDAG